MALKHVVVDGSNIATEGRNMPSLVQLDEAVQAFIADRPVERLTVVVDATFGHRIPESERPEYEEAIVNGEIVCPPAGAIGRGDAFVLQIADKAGAMILSNDSFQEFHGDYQWLFDEGRLIGGKPVPEVGWVFVDRTPVRGPVSRKATKNARGPRRPRRSSTKAALEADPPTQPPIPTGKKPKVGDIGVPASAAKAATSRADDAPATDRHADNGRAEADRADNGRADDRGDRSSRSGRSGRGRRGAPKVEPTNELLPFLEFIEAHPAGSEVEAEVERFSSHGAYLRVGDILGYAPLRMMGDPPPRSPRELFDMGSTYTLTVVAFDPPRRGVDLTLAQYASGAIAAAAMSTDTDPDESPDAATEEGPAASAAPADTPARPDNAEETPTMATTRKRVAKKAPAKKAVAKKAPARKAGATKTVAKKGTAARKTVTKKASAKKAPAKRVAAKKAPAKRTTAKRAPAKTAAKKTTAKKSTAKKTVAKKTTAKKTTARKTAAKKTTARKAPAKRTAKRA